MLVAIGISEVDFQERTATSWIMYDATNDSFDVALSFGVVEVAIAWRGDAFRFWGSINTLGFTLALASNDFSHRSHEIIYYSN